MKSVHQIGTKRFLIKQILLLVMTVALLILFTIPLLQAVKWSMNPGELDARVETTSRETATIQNEVDAASSKMLMGGDGEETHEKLKKQIEDLQRKLEVRELENNNLREQKALVDTIMHVMNSRTAVSSPSSSAVDTGQKIAELTTKIIGAIGSVFSGGMFFISWWRNRRKSSDSAGG